MRNSIKYVGWSVCALFTFRIQAAAAEPEELCSPDTQGPAKINIWRSQIKLIIARTAQDKQFLLWQNTSRRMFKCIAPLLLLLRVIAGSDIASKGVADWGIIAEKTSATTSCYEFIQSDSHSWVQGSFPWFVLFCFIRKPLVRTLTLHVDMNTRKRQMCNMKWTCEKNNPMQKQNKRQDSLKIQNIMALGVSVYLMLVQQ